MRLILSCCCILGLVLTQVSAVPPENCPGDFHSICHTDFRYKVPHDWIPYASDSSEDGIRWRMVIDQFDYQNIIGEFSIPEGVWKAVDHDGDGLGFLVGSGGTCNYQVRSSSFRRPNQNNWLFTQARPYCDAVELIVNATVRFSSCTQRPDCDHDYVILYRFDTNSPKDEDPDRTIVDNYHWCFQNETDSQLKQNPQGGDTMIIKSFLRPNTSHTYFGFQDIGTTGQVIRFMVYYKVCQKNEKGLALYPEVPLPPSSTPNTRTMRLAECVPNAHNITSLETYAYSDSCDQNVKCECDIGYEESEDSTSCISCKKGFYKSSKNTTCVQCPLNAISNEEAADHCECENGFYRADYEGIGVDCTAPPGPIPNDLRVTTICATTAELEWDQPEDVGREDFYYNISRSNPDSDESIIVNPHYADDSDAVKYTVTGLRPGTIYTFSVCVHNGVSEHDDANAKLRVVSTQGTTKPGSMFIHNNVALPNNSAILREEIGEGDMALCCSIPSDEGCGSGSSPEIYFPNKTKVSGEGTMYTTDGNGLCLNRQSTDKSPLGVYCCLFLDSEDNEQIICAKVATIINIPASCPLPEDESDVKCLSLEDPDGGQVSISGDLTPGSVATYSCDDGRTLFGSSTRDCQSDGTWSDETPKCDYPVGFSLNGQYYPNGSAISLSSIGQDDSALRCLTNGTCCIPPNRAGEFYYPDGSKVNTQATGEDFYRNRGEMMIRLHRRNGAASPTGLYKCVIPDSSGELMTLHITLNRLTSQ